GIHDDSGFKSTIPKASFLSCSCNSHMRCTEVSVGDQGSNSAATVRRRAALCDELGIGMCNGKQLLRQLNSYGFSMDDVVSVLNQLELGGVR
ncbi:hypothetical protein APUTEX25_002879, partial [Auxenochlorella protothecoides]